MLFGYQIRQGGSVEVEVGYKTKEAAIEASEFYQEDGWEVFILEYNEEYATEVEKQAAIGKVADACNSKYLQHILEDL